MLCGSLLAEEDRPEVHILDNYRRISLAAALAGLALLALAIIAMADLGAVGRAVVMFFRFFFGEWYMLSLVGLVVFSIFIMWKRSPENALAGSK